MLSPYPFCIRFFTEMKALGVKEVIISPGSRNTPLVLSAHSVGLTTKVLIDERTAGFYALGNAKKNGTPCILVCTSGTASANYLPAVIEANHAGVPMIICSADRPPEQRQWGAGQTIDQVNLYGSNVRWSYDLPVAAEVDEMFARSIAVRSWERSVHGKGPVHLNWPFREPLEPNTEINLPEATVKPFEASIDNLSSGRRLKELAQKHEKGLIIVGPNDLPNNVIQQICNFSKSASWPIISDPGSQMRGGSFKDSPNIITTGEIICSSERFLHRLEQAEIIINVGLTPTSKSYKNWLIKNPPVQQILVAPGTDWNDPANQVTEILEGNPFYVFSESATQIRPKSEWLSEWSNADALAVSMIRNSIKMEESEVSAIYSARMGIVDTTTIVLSNSMVIRDAELAFLNEGKAFRTITNRGANGIDGIISTSIGVAHASVGKTLTVVGDVAATHDLGGFLAAKRLETDLTIVIFDNGGGGIFSFLPISRTIETEVFEKFYETPPHAQIPEILNAAGISVEAPQTSSELTKAVTEGLNEGGLKVIWYQTNSKVTEQTFQKLRENFNNELLG